MSGSMDWDAAFEEAAAQAASTLTPELEARTKAKSLAEFQRGIELGWWDAEGNSLTPADPDDPDDPDNEDDPDDDQAE